MDDARKPLVALVVLLVITLPVVIVLLVSKSESGGSAEKEQTPARVGGLRVEPTPGVPELTVSLEDPSLNIPRTARRRGTVTLECIDQDGRVVLSEPQIWPFGAADEVSGGPHVHVRVEPQEVDRVARCRLLGTEPELEGRRF